MTADEFLVGWNRMCPWPPPPQAGAVLAVIETALGSFDGLPALQLGALEGLWAVVYQRRGQLEAQYQAQFDQIMAGITALDWGSVVDTLTTQQLINPGVTGTALAAVVIVTAAQLIATTLPPDTLAAWQQLVTSALVDATAEGTAVGIAQLAQPLTIDWNLAGTDAKQALQDAQWVTDNAAQWVAKQTHGLAYQIGQKLASLWDDGASRDQMITAITDITGSSPNMAGLLLDHAISRSLSFGALSTYQQAAVELVDFLTAGDNRVCAVPCYAAESNSPYKLENAPHPGLHVRCRCTLSPSGQTLTSAGTALISRYTNMEGVAA